uniref:Uncharacterized protein n=2 Tax=Anguilla anguilla TaxID=7936 RepID=A0A0E9RPD0_ANGAN
MCVCLGVCINEFGQACYYISHINSVKVLIGLCNSDVFLASLYTNGMSWAVWVRCLPWFPPQMAHRRQHHVQLSVDL